MTNPEHASLEQYVNMPELLARVDNDHELLAERGFWVQGRRA